MVSNFSKCDLLHLSKSKPYHSLILTSSNSTVIKIIINSGSFQYEKKWLNLEKNAIN